MYHADSVAATPQRVPSSPQSGFALVAALTIMSLVVMLILSLTLQTRVELRSADNARQRLLAKENARLGLMVALGELQKYAGPDQRVTARAETAADATPGTEKWTGVWDPSSGSSDAVTWLVSGQNPNLANGVNSGEFAMLAPANSQSSAVRANWVSTESQGSTQGRFAYWVQEENVKARVNLIDNTEAIAYLPEYKDRQDAREQVLQSPAHRKIFAELAPEPEANPLPEASVLKKLNRVHSTAQVGLLFPDNIDRAALLVERQHDFTVDAAGVLENSLSGGLKVNLSGRTQAELDALLALPENENDHYLKGDFLSYHNLNPATGEPFSDNTNPNNPSISGSSFSSSDELLRIPKEDFFAYRNESMDSADNETEVVRNIMPVVTEASFRLGAFHTQSDTKHRIRFHADVEFWNPYPFPIRFPGEGSSRVFTVLLVPSQFGAESGDGAETEQLILSVEKLEAGPESGGSSINEELHTNLFDFDEQLGSVLGGGRTNNTINETVMTSWMIIQDVVLQPGEIYHASTNRAVGLARDLGGFVLKSGGDRMDPADYIVDTNHDYNKWSWHATNNPSHPVLEADEIVRISLRVPENGLTFRVIPFDSRSTNNSPVHEENPSNSWAVPVWELRNIYKLSDQSGLFDELAADEYSRATSGAYTINDYTMGFHFKFDDERVLSMDPSASTLSLGFDLRQPVWDFTDPAVKSALIVGGVLPEDALAGVEPNPMEAPAQRDLFFNGIDLFADNNPDSHNGDYERVLLYPGPTSDPRSVGSFQHLPLSPETVSYDPDGTGINKTVQLKVGMPWSEPLNSVFDKYFFSGAPPAGWNSGDPLPVPTEILSAIDNTRLRQSDAASALLIKGAFNLNSLSGPAWAAMLSRTLENWQYQAERPAANSTNLRNAFLNLSDSTDAAIQAFGSILDDEDLIQTDTNDIGASNRMGRLAMRYPLRQLDDKQIHNLSTPESDSLVEYLLDEMRSYFADNGPFTSVSAFVNSGVLQRAINDSGINGNVPRFSPAYITQASVLEPIAPFLGVRSDTFIIRSIGQVEDRLTGTSSSQIMLEAVVQRVPQRVDADHTRIMENATSNNNNFGRKFIVKSITWKEPLL